MKSDLQSNTSIWTYYKNINPISMSILSSLNDEIREAISKNEVFTNPNA